MLPIPCPRCRARIYPLRAERQGAQRRCPHCGCYVECVNGWKISVLLGVLLGAGLGLARHALHLNGWWLAAIACILAAAAIPVVRLFSVYVATPRPVPVSPLVRRLGRIANLMVAVGIGFGLLPGALVALMAGRVEAEIRAGRTPDPDAIIMAIALAAAVPLAISLTCAGIALGALARQARARRAQLAAEQA